MDVYKDFNINDYTFRLSYRDPKNTEKYFANDEMWERSQSMLKAAMDSMGLDYYEAEGEAAFYGPKLDIQTKTAWATTKRCPPSNWTSCCLKSLTSTTLVKTVSNTAQS
jgi:threonyl-tRNA synthetase